MERWFFHTHGDNIEMLARLEGTPGSPDEGMIGDAHATIRPGGRVLNLTYGTLRRARAGSIVIEDGKARIEV
jgi:hypothetical protein